MEEKVELHDAYFFTCPSCGKENFMRAMAVEMGDEDLQSLKMEFDIPEDNDGYFTNIPTLVVCKGCSREFEVEEESDEDDDLEEKFKIED